MKVFPSEGEQRVALDLKDRKILYLLSLNSRLPLSKVAELVSLSRDAVAYRLKRLETAKVIQGYRTVINFNKLGYFSYHLFLDLHHTRQSEERLSKFFLENENVNALLKYSGKWDFELAFLAKNPFEFERFLSQTIGKAGVLQDYEILILLETIKATALPEIYSKDFELTFDYKKNDSSFYKDFEAKEEKMEVDETDLKILRILSENARISLIELANKVSLSDDAVIYRIKKMIRGKIIIGFRPVINFSALNLSIYTVMFKLQNISDEKEKEFKNFLKGNANVLWAVKTIGRVNVLAYILSQTQGDFHDTMAEIKNRFGEIIKNYESLFAYQELKYTYLPEGVKN